ncbi:hypothetical protein J2T12_002029 [Paenibacillus anaericanus]|uniref:hypothetical protein n=1 Tax=Paenibacillus anaericanus TaxID=170367 RepID=UPI002789FD3A|nr:hypothetical protein [Paenibacillus anaericanus]MDQ0088619.1 hypothetical protein [Paenibacillus anaericanus]
MSYQDKLFLIITLFVIVLSIVGTVIYRHNRLKHQVNEPPSGFQKTNEIFIDPTTGIKQQVWYNPKSGERYYKNIDENNRSK